jgi:hypothetical protein
MRTVLAVAVLVTALTGCEARDREAGEGGALERDEAAGDTTMRSADTAITEREVEDTTIVRTDTTVRVDTVKKTGPGDTTGEARRTRP